MIGMIRRILSVSDKYRGRIYGAMVFSFLKGLLMKVPIVVTYFVVTTYIDGTLIVNKSFSIPYDPATSLTAEATKAFNEMQSAASKQNATLSIVSGYRSWGSQTSIYNRYRSNDPYGADTYSARPGHSEHQTGLAIDFEINSSFGETTAGKWLSQHSWEYGYILRYPYGKEPITGYMYEPWHFRYVGKDLAKKLYNSGDWLTIEEYFGIDSKYAN